MSWWCKELLRIGGQGSIFAHSMIEEEAKRSDRLARALAVAGTRLPHSYSFIFPNEENLLFNTCRTLQREGWKLSIRIVEPITGKLTLRILNGDLNDVENSLKAIQRERRLVVNIDPNREPEISGTVLSRHGNANMEMVYGPHHWLSDLAADGVKVYRCWFVFPHISVRYNTQDIEKRGVLFRHFSRVIRICLGMGIREFAGAESSLYVEFQWHSEFGYRFFDISQSWVWAG